MAETCDFDGCNTLAELDDEGNPRRVCRRHRRRMEMSGAW